MAGKEPLAMSILFFDRLFTRSPSMRSIFRSPMSLQTMQFMSAVGCCINQNSAHFEVNGFNDAIEHKGYDKAILDALLWAIQQRLGNAWNEEVKAAWSECYVQLSAIMVQEKCAA